MLRRIANYGSDRAMSKTDVQSKAASNRVYSPLFPKDDEREGIYADLIARLSIYRQHPSSGNRSRRIKISNREFSRPTGEEFAFNPFETTEDDIEAWFGGGEFYIQPFDKMNNILGGRVINLGGPTRGSGAFSPGQSPFEQNSMPEIDPMMFVRQQPQSSGEPDSSGSAVKVVLESQKEMLGMMKDTLEGRARSAEENSSKREDSMTTIVAALIGGRQQQGNDPAAMVAIETLRRDMEDTRRQHMEELRRKDRENEEERSRYRAEIDRYTRLYDDYRKTSDDEKRELRSRHDRETDDLRRRLATEVDDAKKKADRDVDDLKHRYEREATAEVDRVTRRLKDTEKELEETRAKMQQRVFELEKEAIEMTRELASIPEQPPAPKSGKDDEPWWGPYVPDALKAAQQIANRLPGQPPGQPGQPPGRAVVQSVPMPPQQQFQQFQPPPRVMDSPPPAPAPAPPPPPPVEQAPEQAFVPPPVPEFVPSPVPDFVTPQSDFEFGQPMLFGIPPDQIK